jgi:hypothetical protein
MHAVLAKVSQSLNIEATASVEQIDAPENGGRP